MKGKQEDMEESRIIPVLYMAGSIDSDNNNIFMHLSFYDMNGNRSDEDLGASREITSGFITAPYYSLQYTFTPSGPCTCGAIVTDNDKVTLMKPRSKVCECKIDGVLAMSIILPSEAHPHNSSTIYITLKPDKNNKNNRFIIDLSCCCISLSDECQKTVLIKTSKDSGATFKMKDGEDLGIVYVLYLVENHDQNVFGGDDYIYPSLLINKNPHSDPNFDIDMGPTIKNSIFYEGNFESLILNGWEKVCSGIYSTQEQITSIKFIDGAILIP